MVIVLAVIPGPDPVDPGAVEVVDAEVEGAEPG
jgi:hypothetical protein